MLADRRLSLLGEIDTCLFLLGAIRCGCVRHRVWRVAARTVVSNSSLWNPFASGG
ncbi:hypothetical protein T484DRAFT_1962764 [Baffinella frigidus]|nr:hypothetical protein T484DRAFT_1962764 [Cryptophyta sp. CCMP2293]